MTPVSEATTTTTTTLQPPIIITDRPLLGQNGTGQRWSTAKAASTKQQQPTVVSEPISPGLLGAVTLPPNAATASTVNPPQTTAGIQTTTAVPRRTPGIAIPPAAKFDPPASSSWEEQYVNVGNIDTDNSELTDDELRLKNLTLGHEEHHTYYNSTTLQNTETVQEYLRSFQNLTPNSMLSKSHRRAMVRREEGGESREC